MSEALEGIQLLSDVSSAISKLQKSQEFAVSNTNIVGKSLFMIREAEEISSRVATKTLVGRVKIDGETINIDEEGTIYAEDLTTSDTLLSNPTITITQQPYIGYDGIVTVSASSYLSGQTFKFYISIQELDISEVELTPVNGSASYTFTVPSSMESGVVLHISAVAEDGTGNMSEASTAQVTVTSAYVNTPSITSPIENAEIYSGASGVAVEGSSFSTTGITDTHASTDWKITSDSAGNTVVAQELDSNDKTSHTFTGLSLSDNTTYYIWIRYNGTELGASEWSNGVAFVNKNGYVNAPVITSPSANTEILKNNGLTVTLNTFSSVGASDTQVSIQVDICFDSNGENVAVTKTVNGTGDTATFSSSDLGSLTNGTTYYLVAYRTGSILGESGKSIGIGVSFTSISATLENNSWEIIQQVGEEGNGANYWDIGDRKSVVLNGTIGTLSLSNQTFDVYIIEFNYRGDNGVYFQGFKDHSAGTDLALCDSSYNSYNNSGTKIFNMNHRGNYNYGGWKGCDLRYDILGSTSTQPSGYTSTPTTSRVGYDATTATRTSPVANTLMAALPSALRSVLALWTVYTDNIGNGSGASSDVTSSVDYLPLLSEFEVHGTRTYANQYEKNSQAQMAYYKNGASKVKYNHSQSATAVGWRLRSAHYSIVNYFCHVETDGRANVYNSAASYGLAPAFRIAKSLITPSGRKIWRHENDKGSVIEFDMFGKTVQMFVADAQYRTKLQFSTSGTESSLTNFDQKNADNDIYITGTESSMSTTETDNPPTFTDAQLQVKWGTAAPNPNLSTDLTARQNCDVWMTQSVSNTSSQAVGYARSLTSFTGITGGCDIPNLYELMVIFIEANYIDSLDPTISSYQKYALGNTAGFSGYRWYFDGTYVAWSSTETASNFTHVVNRYGNCGSYNKPSAIGVIPVREL